MRPSFRINRAPNSKNHARSPIHDSEELFLPFRKSLFPDALGPDGLERKEALTWLLDLNHRPHRRNSLLSVGQIYSFEAAFRQRLTP